MDDAEVWSAKTDARPYGNFVVDSVNHILYNKMKKSITNLKKVLKRVEKGGKISVYLVCKHLKEDFLNEQVFNFTWF